MKCGDGIIREERGIDKIIKDIDLYQLQNTDKCDIVIAIHIARNENGNPSKVFIY